MSLDEELLDQSVQTEAVDQRTVDDPVDPDLQPDAPDDLEGEISGRLDMVDELVEQFLEVGGIGDLHAGNGAEHQRRLVAGAALQTVREVDADEHLEPGQRDLGSPLDLAFDIAAVLMAQQIDDGTGGASGIGDSSAHCAP